MNKNWLTLVIIAVITIIGIIVYQFYNSISGANADFNKSVTSINSDLGMTTLNAVKKLDENVPVRDEALDNK